MQKSIFAALVPHFDLSPGPHSRYLQSELNEQMYDFSFKTCKLKLKHTYMVSKFL